MQINALVCRRDFTSILTLPMFIWSRLSTIFDIGPHVIVLYITGHAAGTEDELNLLFKGLDM